MDIQSSFRLIFSRSTCLLLGMILIISSTAQGETVQLVGNNINNVLSTHEVVFVNFYADWCRFSQMLSPVFEDASKKIKELFPEPNKVAFGKVDCDSETAIATMYHISKYPTLKLFRHGQIVKKEYRGQRSVSAFTDFIKSQVEDSIKQHTNTEEVDEIQDSKRIMVGYFQDKESDGYKTYRRVASQLRDDCIFHAVTGEGSLEARQGGGDKVAFRPPRTRNEDLPYQGDVSNYDVLYSWAQSNCVPLVREITFENAEELTEEGLPFLILFHQPDDREIVEAFTNAVTNQLLDEKSSVNFLTADGTKFTHPLHHLGKTPSDLPVLAIDSFRHMYLFKHNVKEDMETPGLLKEFIQDLHSGKLHREFHHGPDPTQPPSAPASQESNTEGTQAPEKTEPPSSEGQAEPEKSTQAPSHLPHDTADSTTTQHIPSSPPESSFKKLKPSDNRYTILVKDEL